MFLCHLWLLSHHHGRVESLGQKSVWLAKPNYLLSGPCQEKFADRRPTTVMCFSSHSSMVCLGCSCSAAGLSWARSGNVIQLWGELGVGSVETVGITEPVSLSLWSFILREAARPSLQHLTTPLHGCGTSANTQVFIKPLLASCLLLFHQPKQVT